jgi:hypothetical protein
MNHINENKDNHLTQILHLLSVYRVLLVTQLEKLYPELSKDKLLLLIRRLEKNGRIVYTKENGMLQYSKDCIPSPSTITAFWVLLDFAPEVIYHTVSDFPSALSFYTADNSYDVIYAAQGKELPLTLALSNWHEDSPKRLVIVELTEQIPLLQFPGIIAYCTVDSQGTITYYKKQGVADNS